MPPGFLLLQLENESIAISGETAAAFRKPVMLYSTGKEPSVLHHPAPGPIHFPLMLIDETWKFKEMSPSGTKQPKTMDLNWLFKPNTMASKMAPSFFPGELPNIRES